MRSARPRKLCEQRLHYNDEKTDSKKQRTVGVFIYKIHQLGGSDTLYGTEVSKAHLSVDGGGFQTKHFGFVGSMVKQFLLSVLHFLFVLAFV